MRFPSTISLITASLALAPALSAQAAVSTAWCSNSADSVPIDSLRALALKYHPEAFKPEVRRDSVLVGLVLDSSCRVIEHAVARYHANRVGTDDLLRTAIPTVQLELFLIAGVAEATNAQGPGTPWIVWVSKQT